MRVQSWGAQRELKAVGDLGDVHHHVESMQHVSDALPHVWSSFLTAADAIASPYSKVDKTGVIGGIANVIEAGIDLAHEGLAKAGVPGTYGISICLFTALIKTITLPLTTQQLESTAKMQKLTPLQRKITDAFPRPEDEQTKNQLVAQLFQAANVNPLAGCFPALVQIPIFLSLYRALQNLIAEDKLTEGFLWIPNLEGPIYKSQPGETFDWVKSIITGDPILGWDNTLAFLTLPVILFISQSFSTRILQPPKDPDRQMTEQEQFSQGLVNNLPFIVSFFSLGVPAGLAVYWVVNNILTTLVTVVVKSNIKDEPLSMEVEEIMAAVKRGGGSGRSGSMPRGPTPSQQEFRGGLTTEVPTKPKAGFADAVDVEFNVPEASAQQASPDSSPAIDNDVTAEDPDAPKGPIGKALKAMNEAGKGATGGVSTATPSAPAAVSAASATSATADGPKRKKRQKPNVGSGRKKKKKGGKP